jgi:MoxR-like ATPase
MSLSSRPSSSSSLEPTRAVPVRNELRDELRDELREELRDEIRRIAGERDAVIAHVERTIVGKTDVVQRVLAALTAGGHVLLVDVPGVGKTALARGVAAAIDLDFRRVQFTPDLLPLDITGSQIFDLKNRAFQFIPGPVFTNLLLADEINRAPPKTQAALLEVMAERQVTIDGVTHRLQRPFGVIATMNPLDHDGTYALPQAQLDRFTARLRMGFPDAAAEVRMLDVHLADDGGTRPAPDPVLSRARFVRWQALVADVFVADDLKKAAVEVIRALRADPACVEPPSPRATLSWVRLAMATALLAGRDHLLPADLVATAADALAHRLQLEQGLSPEGWVDEVAHRVLSRGTRARSHERSERGDR